MTSRELKAEVLFYMLYRLHFMAAVTEYGGVGCEGIADLFGITGADLTHEIEVKVSKADLMGEIAAIKYHLQEKLPPTMWGGRPEHREPPPKNIRKSTKHWWYLVKEGAGYEDWRRKPNRFSFAVPRELEEIAKQELKGTPYGLIVVGGAYVVSTEKKAEYLHKEKVNDAVLRKVLHKSCTEIQSLRSAAIKVST